MAINRHEININRARERKFSGEKCVFISHQKGDRIASKKVADYLLNAGVDVYFDEYDGDLKIHRQNQNHKAITDSICKGIELSTHMLCVVSPKTLTSSWVPFEVGYGFDKTELGVLTLKGISSDVLPEYVKTANFIVRDIYDVNELVSMFRNRKAEWLIESDQIKNFSMSMHPLSAYMDSLIS